MKFYSIMLSGLLCLPAQAFAQTVVIGTADAYDAGIYTVDPATLQGFDRALGEALCQRGKLTCEWKAMSRDMLLPALKSKDVDVVMAAIPLNAELGEGVETTAAYVYPDPFARVGVPGLVPAASVKTLATVPEPNLDEWVKTTGYKLIYFPTLREAMTAVENGDADVAFGEYEAFAPLLQSNVGKLDVVSSGIRHRPGLAMVLDSDNVDLRFTFEDLIYDMKQDGSLNTLTKEWFGSDAVEW